MKTKYFYCGSTQALLYALAQNDYTIIARSKIADKLCAMNNRKCVKISIPVTFRDIVFKPGIVKSEIKRLLEIIRNDELHFSHTQFAVFCFLLIDKARKNSIPVYYHNFEFVYQKANYIPLDFNSIKTYLMVKFTNMVYNIDLTFKQISVLVPSIDSDFIKSRNIKTVDLKNNYFNITQQLFTSAPVLDETYDFLFLTQNLLHSSSFNYNELIRVYSELVKQNVSVKLHPGMKEAEANYFDNANILDQDIPAEFYFNSVNKAVVSMHSAALITASKFSHLKSISLIDMVNTNNPNFFKKVKEDLIYKSNNRIYFPKSIAELNRLLNEYN